MRLDSRVALVTGGARGIGRAVVERMTAEGARVIFVDAGPGEAIDAVAAELTAQGRAVRGVQADVRDAQRAQETVDEIVSQHERLDILVNCAGIVRDGLLGTMTADQWRDVIEINLGGSYNYCRAVTQQMMYQRRGSIVNVSSTSAEFASRGQVNYAASKGGINGMTRAMAKELAPRGVRVNAVAPGMIDTDMSKPVRALAGDRINDMIPLRRIGAPAEVAGVITFLASDEAAYITGQILRVDGGLSLGSH